MRHVWKYLILLSLLLSVCAVAEVDATPLQLGKPVTVVIASSEPVYYSFTPTKSGVYCFYSDDEGEGDPYGELCDADMNVIASNDDGYNNCNFIIELDLEAGKTYILHPRFYRSGYMGQYRVTAMPGLNVAAVGETEHNVELNDTVTFQVEASTSMGRIHYQWAVFEGDEDHGGDWQDIPGETGVSMTTAPFTRYTRYLCRVTNDYGQQRSVEFSVDLDNSFRASYVSGSFSRVAPGTPVRMEASASCAVGEPSYQWFIKDGDAIPGATGAVYELNASKNEEYQCRVTDIYGHTKWLGFTVIIENHLDVSRDSNHYVDVPLGGSTTLMVKASADAGGLSYQWAYEDGDDIPGANSASLTLTNIRRKADYECWVTDVFGNRDSTCFHITIDNHFSLSRVSEHDIYVTPGSDVTLEVAASCKSGTLNYRWEENGEDIPGENGPRLVVRNVQKAKDYECYVWDEYDNFDSRCFHIYVDNGLNVDDGKKQVLVPYGETTQLKVSAYCDDGQLKYEWRRSYYSNGSFHYEDIENDSPTLNTAPIEGQNEYKCWVSDNYGNSKDVSFIVTVDTGLKLTPVGKTNIARTDSPEITLAVKAECSDKALEYYWSGRYFNLDTHAFSYINHSGSNDTSHTLADNEAYGSYTCRVTDPYGNSAEVTFNVTLDTGLTATAVGSRFRYQSIGDRATLKVNASVNMGGLSYQWFDAHGEIIEGVNGPTFTTPALESTGRYLCRITDDFLNSVNVDFVCAVDLETLMSGQEYSFNFNESEWHYYLFRPDVTDDYAFNSYGSSDPMIELYDENKELIAQADNTNDDNFCLVERLYAGKTYLVGLYLYEETKFTMKIASGSSQVLELEDNWTLRKGQTVVMPPIDFYQITQIESRDPSVVSVSGDRLTARKAGSTVVKVTFQREDYPGTWCEYCIVYVWDAPALKLPAGLKVLDEEAFAGDGSMRFVEVGNAVKLIGRNAFNGSGLAQVVVTSGDTIPSGGWLQGTSNVTIICPKGSWVERYCIDKDIPYLNLP